MSKECQTRISVVIPTYNERGNVAEIIRRIDMVFAEISWQLIFVDDASPDGTADVVRYHARRDPRINLISRHNRRGLSSAVVEGALAASADIVAVMDGDLQHDESILPSMYKYIADDEAEIVSASRFLREDGADGLSSNTRLQISNAGIRLANFLFRLNLTDPLTGFFVLRRDLILRALPDLSGVGFKILMDVITSLNPRPRVMEVPFQFRARLHGESKLDNRVMYDFFLFFIEKKFSRFLPIPAEFISFAMINALGILVHMAVLLPAVNFFNVAFAIAQLVATLIAMMFNYTVNNALTYRDRQLKGKKFYLGFLMFALCCSVGLYANVGVASVIHDRYTELFYVIPALAGALIAVVWNYVATKAFVWGRTRLPWVWWKRHEVVLPASQPNRN